MNNQYQLKQNQGVRIDKMIEEERNQILNTDGNFDEEDVELTDAVIENYFAALQKVSQNIRERQQADQNNQLDAITEYSGESEVTIDVTKLPNNNKQELELKSMIQQLDHEEIVNISKLKNSIEFSQQLQNLGLLQALPQRERSNSFVKSKSFK